MTFLNLFGGKKTAEDELADELEQKLQSQPFPSVPRAVLRPLRQPLYDREYVTPESYHSCEFFSASLGRKNSLGRTKTVSDTNLLEPSLLGMPVEFDLHAFRVEPCAENDPKDWLRYYNEATFTWSFGQGKPWLQVPLSYIPCTATIATDEEIARYASALVCPDNEKWKDLIVVDPGNEKRIDQLFDEGQPFRVERRRSVTHKRRPTRIRSRETFSVSVCVPGELELKGNLGFRVYMEGILYSAL